MDIQTLSKTTTAHQNKEIPLCTPTPNQVQFEWNLEDKDNNMQGFICNKAELYMTYYCVVCADTEKTVRWCTETKQSPTMIWYQQQQINTHYTKLGDYTVHL